jgi:SAM-dependent methyltransferase
VADTDADGYFGEDVAQEYDETEDPMFADEVVRPVVDFIERLARGRSVLEFAIGTGRIAVPLAERGVDVHGIELSQAMVRQLRAKPGGHDLPVTIGDMSTVRAPGEFGVVYLVFNTIMNLTTQDGQVACFQNAAAHLGPGGKFVIETMVPDLRKLPTGERYVLFDATAKHWGIDEYDVVNQGLVSHHFAERNGSWDLSEGPFRYVWPSELDLMARIAGMRLVSRDADSKGAPFTEDSRSHVSVWEKRE